MSKKNPERKAVLALLFRTVGLVSGIVGIVIHMLVNSVFSNGFMVKHNLAYFTLQTNIFICIIFAVLIFKTIVLLGKNKKMEIAHMNHSLHLACTLYITITMLGYWLVLCPLTGLPKAPLLWCDTLFLHTITPIFAILDWIFFMDHGKLKKLEAVKWLGYPVIYLVSVIIVAQLIKEPYYSFKMGEKIIGLMYPYPFLDPSVVGIGGVIGVCAVLALFFTLLGLLYIFIDKKLRGKIEK